MSSTSKRALIQLLTFMDVLTFNQPYGQTLDALWADHNIIEKEGVNDGECQECTSKSDLFTQRSPAL